MDPIINVTEVTDPTGGIDSHVTRSQLNIVQFPPDHNCILSVQAGPGSGKTSTLSNRIAHLIAAHEIKPEEIVVLSMTNRSVISLRESLTNKLGEELTSCVNLSTFHSFCAKLVDNHARQYLPHMGERKFVDDLSWKYFSNIFSGKFVELDGQNIEGTLSSTQFDQLVSLVRSGRMSSEQAAVTYKVNKKYVDMLIEYLDSTGMIRYTDLVNNAFKIMESSLEEGNSLLEELSNCKVVIVDEFQDMYEELLSIIKIVVQYPTIGHDSGTVKHLTIAGDPNQSIYEFLGSKPDVMDNLAVEFNGTKDLSIHNTIIEESFRCTPEILDCALSTCLTSDTSKRIKSVKPSGHLPIICEFKSPNAEYTYVIKEITRLCCESGGLLKLSDFLIVARSNKEVEEINRVLSENYGIKFNKLSSSLSWVKSKVSILLNILSVLERSSGSELSLLCLLMCMDTDFGAKTRISKVFTMSRNWAKREQFRDGGTLEDYVISNLLNETPKSFSIKNIYKTSKHQMTWSKTETLMKLVIDERSKLSQNYDNQDPSMILSSLLTILENSVLQDYLNVSPKVKKSMGVQEVDDVVFKYRKELFNDLNQFNASLNACFTDYKRQDILDTTGESFVSYFLKKYDEDFQILSDDSINTSTIHAAKGLEFPVVFVIGTSSFWSSPWASILTRKEQTESSNSRLLYVAFTRAKSLLYLGSSLQIADISDDVLDAFTTIPPEMNDDTIESLAQDLKREMPQRGRIDDGKDLFQQFKSLTQTRSYSTSSTSYTMPSYQRVHERVHERVQERVQERVHERVHERKSDTLFTPFQYAKPHKLVYSIPRIQHSWIPRSTLRPLKLVHIGLRLIG